MCVYLCKVLFLWKCLPESTNVGQTNPCTIVDDVVTQMTVTDIAFMTQKGRMMNATGTLDETPRHGVIYTEKKE